MTDHAERVGELRSLLSFHYRLEILNLQEIAEVPLGDRAIVLDCDLGNRDTATALKALFARGMAPANCLFLSEQAHFLTRVRKDALGGGQVIARDADRPTLINAIETIQRRVRPCPAPHAPQDILRVLDLARRLQQDLAITVHCGHPLPKAHVEKIGAGVVDTMAQHGIDTWIETVRHYHSHTYRHSMMVTGYAVAFGQHLGLSRDDNLLLAVSGLLHDVGKLKVPLTILDKPAELTSAEFELIKRHPVHSREILEQDGQFARAVIDAAAHHHEYLDGSGYPDALPAEEISPLVRMITIADIFAALTEERSYKSAYSKRTAFGIMSEMKSRLDVRLLTAFRGVVLDEAFGRVRTRPKTTDTAAINMLMEGRHPLDASQSSAA